MQLEELDALPEGLLELPAPRLHERLSGPTLIHLPGRRPRPVFVAVLLHGNEDTGWEAMRALLHHYQTSETPLPRALSLFIGNVSAARAGLRRLDGQPDYNRVWPGGDHPRCEETQLMRAVVAQMRARDVFISLDLHNNTGLNPHYACINRLEDRFFHLATLFSRTVVYFTRPQGVQSLAFAKLCPSVTLECGPVGAAHGIKHAREFVDACLHLSDLPRHPFNPQDIDLFHTVATVKIPQHLSFGFGDAEADLRFSPDLDHLNFRELPAHTTLASIRPGSDAFLDVHNETGAPVGERYFSYDDGILRTRRPLMPSMFTLNEQVIRQDCLGYLMERLSLEG